MSALVLGGRYELQLNYLRLIMGLPFTSPPLFLQMSWNFLSLFFLSTWQSAFLPLLPP